MVGIHELKLVLLGASISLISIGAFKKRYYSMGVGWVLAIIALLLPS